MWAMENGRFAGMTAEFAKHGVYAFSDLDEDTQEYKAMVHIASGTKVVIEDIKPKTNWVIEDNYNEFAANAKGPRGRHQVIGLFESPESTEQEPTYLIPLPCFLSSTGPIASEAASGSGSGILIANVPSAGPTARRRLARRGSAASSVMSEPAGDGVHGK